MHNDAGTVAPAGVILVLEKVIETAPIPAKIAAGVGLALLMYGPKLIKCFKKKKKERLQNHTLSNPDHNQSPPEDDEIVENNNENTEKKIQKALVGSNPGRKTKRKTKQYEKPSKELNDANKDFDKMELTEIKTIEIGRVGLLPDGSRVIVRSKSDDGRPTLEIQDQQTGKKIKIRYGKLKV